MLPLILTGLTESCALNPPTPYQGPTYPDSDYNLLLVIPSINKSHSNFNSITPSNYGYIQYPATCCCFQ